MGVYDRYRLCFVISQTLSKNFSIKFLKKEINGFVLFYLSDISIFSNLIKEHWENLKMAWERFLGARLYGSVQKRNFLKARVDYFGFEVGEPEEHASPSKVKLVVG